MATSTIRQSGNANIVSIPKAVLSSLGLSVGSDVEISIDGNRLVLTPVQKEETLEDLLAGSPKERLALTEEDQEWLGMHSVGKEV
ncbi:AbrB/MazE/SpoVT family DNA-binding domain-containing protein [Zooshikella sp. RANM57]|uniref:AbrB/MazE/SpoVT family DNA-binding domain-containing protein n=1 Tax=Zooshikella sp. RANM57 TaxID=3425863 RepID=UPI003D6DD100